MSHSPLSQHEKSLLEQLEKQFKEDDPIFANAMEPEPARKRSALRLAIGPTSIAAGILLVVLGATLQGAVPAVLVGVLGFATMIAGGHFAVQHTSGGRNKVGAPVIVPADSVGGQKAGKDCRFFKDGVGHLALCSLFWCV
ncbi:hypothetical protein QFZ69_004693 [Arthrobacter sp. V1I7]|uniref:DUF3040 domain-containing protein n=1 Tax=Arthrobacter sp. V1I7 TaxID=3042274 RepID=UPI0027849919|nr:DUF3040 domain-containing protein [Arthrobacter sp. V1I7]MDQ0823747.1 hypothetical protein [Arthrobacter sp. V1I7]